MKIEYKGQTYDVKIDSIALEQYFGKLSYYETGLKEFVKAIKDCAAQNNSQTKFVMKQGRSYFLCTPSKINDQKYAADYSYFDDCFYSHVPKGQIWILPGAQGSPECMYDKQKSCYRNCKVQGVRIDDVYDKFEMNIIRRKAHPNTLKSTEYNQCTWTFDVQERTKRGVKVWYKRNSEKPTATTELLYGHCYVAGRFSSFGWFDEKSNIGALFKTGNRRNGDGLQKIDCYRFRPVGRDKQDNVGIVTRSIPKYDVYDTIMRNISGTSSTMIPTEIDALDPDSAIKKSTNWGLTAVASIMNPISMVGGNNIVTSGSCYWSNDVGAEWWTKQSLSDPIEYGVALLQETEIIQREILDPLSDDTRAEQVITLPMPVISGFRIASMTGGQTNAATDTTWIVPDWLRMPQDILEIFCAMSMDELALSYLLVSGASSIHSIIGVDSSYSLVTYGRKDFEETPSVKKFVAWCKSKFAQYENYLSSEVDRVRNLYSNIVIQTYCRKLRPDVILVGSDTILLDSVRIKEEFKKQWIKNKEAEERLASFQRHASALEVEKRRKKVLYDRLNNINTNPLLPQGLTISGGEENVQEEVQQTD